MAAHLLEGFSTQGMESRDTIERHERLVALGAVTAGLTHELNNPVAAVMRASARLREMLAEMREKLGLLVRSQLPGDKLEAVADLAARALASRREAPALSPIEASDREDEVADWLSDHGVAGAWDIAPTLVSAGLGVDWLEALVAVTPPPHLDYGLSYPVRAIESDNLLDEITDGVERISGLLASAKQYTQMDRAPLQTFDVHDGLDATLTMLSHKLGDDVKVDPRVRPQPSADRRLSGRAQPGVDEPHRQRHRRDGWAAAPSPCGRGPRANGSWSRSATPARGAGRDPQPGVRTVLHHQGHRQGHRPRARHRLADRRRAPWRRDQPRVGARRHPVHGRTSRCARPSGE